MRKFNLIADVVKRYSVLGLFVAGSLLSSCSKDDDNILPPEPEKPVVPANDTIRLNITDIKSIADVYVKTDNAKKTYILKVTRDLGVTAENVDNLHYFGDWKKQSNVSVDWAKLATKSTRNANADTYVVVPEGKVPLSYEQYTESFGGVPLATNNEVSAESSFITTPQDAEKFSESGVEAVAGYNGENISITAPEQLSAWVDIIEQYAAGQTKSTRGDVHANVEFKQSTDGGLGLRVKNAHVSDLNTVTKYSKITNNRLQADEADVSVTADLLLNYEIAGSKYNNGKLFKVLGADGADLLIDKTNGQLIRTDTASIGTNGAKLQRLVPDKAFVNVHGANASVLSNLADWNYGQIEIVPQADTSLPGKQRALLGHTEETLKLISTPAAPKTSTPYKYNVNPVLTRYTKTAAQPSATDFEGALSVTNFSDGTGDLNYQKVMASNDVVGDGYQALLNTNELKYTCPNNLIWASKLKGRADATEKSVYKYNAKGEKFHLWTNGITAVIKKDEYESEFAALQAMEKWAIQFHEMTVKLETIVDTYHVY